MAVQGDRYATVDATALDLPTNSLGNSSFGGPIGEDLSAEITAYWSYNPENDSGGFSGESWFGMETTNSPVSGQADGAVNAELTSRYDEAVNNGRDGQEAVSEYVNSTILAGWTDAHLTGIINDYLNNRISAPGCFVVG